MVAEETVEELGEGGEELLKCRGYFRDVPRLVRRFLCFCRSNHGPTQEQHICSGRYDFYVVKRLTCRETVRYIIIAPLGHIQPKNAMFLSSETGFANSKNGSVKNFFQNKATYNQWFKWKCK